MAIPRIFLNTDLHLDKEIVLGADQSHYIANVLRLKKNNKVKLFSQDDGDYLATIMSLTRKAVVLQIESKDTINSEPGLRITLVQAISKGDRMDYAIQKATELGVYEIMPVYSEYSSVKRSAERDQKKQQHWQSIAIHAAQQASRIHVPDIIASTTMENWLAEKGTRASIALDPTGSLDFDKLTLQPNELNILIGPEGGFSNRELALFDLHEIFRVRLGPRILRTETATVAALSIIQQRWGDL